MNELMTNTGLGLVAMLVLVVSAVFFIQWIASAGNGSDKRRRRSGHSERSVHGGGGDGSGGYGDGSGHDPDSGERGSWFDSGGGDSGGGDGGGGGGD